MIQDLVCVKECLRRVYLSLVIRKTNSLMNFIVAVMGGIKMNDKVNEMAIQLAVASYDTHLLGPSSQEDWMLNAYIAASDFHAFLEIADKQKLAEERAAAAENEYFQDIEADRDTRSPEVIREDHLLRALHSINTINTHLNSLTKEMKDSKVKLDKSLGIDWMLASIEMHIHKVEVDIRNAMRNDPYEDELRNDYDDYDDCVLDNPGNEYYR